MYKSLTAETFPPPTVYTLGYRRLQPRAKMACEFLIALIYRSAESVGPVRWYSSESSSNLGCLVLLNNYSLPA
jgi:hypothetical protein